MFPKSIVAVETRRQDGKTGVQYTEQVHEKESHTPLKRQLERRNYTDYVKYDKH